ncbi:LPS assembly lipoprotein LptE [Luteibaculum oceani]|uniref:LptE family protein n=1 Tax=Luteibaculum oceani TaxID=1294296 RepID=A0A5C6V4Y4_9FLAO|nr:LptE family protein [Luteibaculum oceani]TXC78858.1 hypothetical protein FRX97_06500 [Luteibaculum oceani]
MRILQIAFFGLVVLCLNSCRVSYSFSGADIPAEAETFSVDYFTSTAALVSPNFNQQFTEALKDLLLAQTPLDIVRSNGDIMFSGTIVKYETRPVAAQGNQTAALDRFTIEVEVSYINRIEPDKNFEKRFSRFVDFESQRNFSDVEEGLAQEITEQLIQEIFNASVGNW